MRTQTEIPSKKLHRTQTEKTIGRAAQICWKRVWWGNDQAEDQEDGEIHPRTVLGMIRLTSSKESAENEATEVPLEGETKKRKKLTADDKENSKKKFKWLISQIPIPQQCYCAQLFQCCHDIGMRVFRLPTRSLSPTFPMLGGNFKPFKPSVTPEQIHTTFHIRLTVHRFHERVLSPTSQNHHSNIRWR